MAKRPRRKMNLPVVMAIVLFYLTVFSTYLTSGLYAKYTAQYSGSDSARVIKFGQLKVTEEGSFGTGNNGGQAIFQPGIDLQKDLTITFEPSETDVYIFAVLETPGWTKADGSNVFTDTAGLGMSWSVDAVTSGEGWKYLDPGEADSNEYIYWQYLDANTDFTDKLIAENGKITVSAETSYKEYAERTENIRNNTLDIKINITAYVVQAGGFTNATDAWTSLSAH